MDLTQLREEIDRIDSELVDLFCQRMEITAKVADYKKEHNLPIAHPSREQEVLKRVANLSGTELEDYTRVLYATIFELSRSFQHKRIE